MRHELFESNISADGSSPGFTDAPFGVSRMSGPSEALIGVFLGSAIDNTGKPPGVNYNGAAALHEVLFPMLQQPFLVGSGRTPLGRARTIVAPNGAARLFLGVLSNSTRSNTGSFTAVIAITGIPEIPGNPLRVYADAQVSLAGQPAGTSSIQGDFVPLNAPALVGLSVVPGQALRIAAIGAVGTANSGFQPMIGPNGGMTGSTDPPYSISRIIGPDGALVGVFLGATVNAARPPDADYSSGTARDLPTQAPLLQQPFFIGTGARANGDFTRFIVPQGATRLFLGILSGTSNINTGSFVATVSPEDPSVPQFTADGLRNAAGFGPGPIAPGMLITLFGKNLADKEAVAAVLPLPDLLGGARVWFDLNPAPLFYASSGQINAQVAPELSQTAIQMVVTRGGVPGLPLTLPLAPYNPGIFTLADSRGAIVNYRTGNLVAPTEPAQSGDVLIIYATGLGPVVVPQTAGTPALANPLPTTTAPVTVRFGSILTTPQYAGLTPGFVGLYQVNVQVPAAIPSGTAIVSIDLAGTSSNGVSVAIQSAQ
jgi:uncharacterized protein (TIGR03437 family)